jgi:hypothetical protein
MSRLAILRRSHRRGAMNDRARVAPYRTEYGRKPLKNSRYSPEIEASKSSSPTYQANVRKPGDRIMSLSSTLPASPTPHEPQSGQ